MSEDTKVTIENQLDGTDITIPVGEGETIENVIKKLYQKLGRDRQKDDRLFCLASGGDVFQYAAMKIKEYIKEGLCQNLVWVFAGKPGGA